MPTGRGWFVAAAGLGLIVCGAVFGAEALQQTGFAILVLVLLAVGVVRLGRHDLEVTRATRPARAAAGQDVAVTLSVRNNGRGPAPLLLVEDGLGRGLSGRTRFTIGGIESGGRRNATYELRPHRRGIYEIGPTTITFVDPFSLAQVRATRGGKTALSVHPAAETLVLPRDVGERRSVTTSALRQPSGARGEDFYTLREYEQGDDLRKIHWPSTAKRGRMMIRQEETPWHTRATIVIDDRKLAHQGSGWEIAFERAIEAAASACRLYHGSGYAFRLAGAHEPGLATSRGLAHYERCLDLLAALRPEPGIAAADSLMKRLAEIEARGAAEETLVLVTGTLERDAGVPLARMRRVFKQVIVVSFPAHRFGTAATKQRWEGEAKTVELVQLLGRSGVAALALGPGERLGPAWATLSTRSRGGESSWARKPEPV